MAVSFTNNWKNVLDKLVSVLRSEFTSSMPVYRGDIEPAGTQFIRVSPTSTDLVTYDTISETRDFNITIQYFFMERNIKEKAFDHIFRVTSRIEALIHDNVTMTLADSTRAFDCHIQRTELNTDEEEGSYLVEFEWVGRHLGNVA